MKIVGYISTILVPLIITVVIIYGVKEHKNVYELFIQGAKEGMHTVINLFPTLLAIFLAVSLLRESGIVESIIEKLNFVNKSSIFPVEILPLAILKPISGSASIAVGTNLMKNYGVDSLIGKIAATIMGSTETTLYVIAIYTSKIKVKKTRHILMPALFADFVGIVVSIIVWNTIY